MALSDDDVREILRIIDESDLAEIKLETDGFSLHVRRGANAGAAPSPSASQPEKPAGANEPRASTQTDLLTIEAPMLGTFYRAEGPGEKPFVDVGTEVGPDSTVCIIEVMK